VKIGSDHLAYSTLVHPGDNWDEIWTSVRTYLPPVKARLSPNDPFGVSLRLAAATVQTLLADPAKIAELRQFFDDNDMYVYTANAFPYGSFKGQRVKEQVYEPDWRSDERVEYTIGVGEILAQLAPEGIAPSIQSPPLGFKPRVTDAAIVDSYAEHVLKVAAALIDIEARTGRTVTLALEPEPMCFLETTAETIDFFTTRLFTGAGAERLGELSGLAVANAHGALRRHIGIVFDPCHQAVEYEDAAGALMALRDAGVPVFKLQQAAALYVPEVTKEAVDRLRRYVETVYLTQTYQRRDGEIQRFLNLARHPLVILRPQRLLHAQRRLTQQVQQAEQPHVVGGDDALWRINRPRGLDAKTSSITPIGYQVEKTTKASKAGRPVLVGSTAVTAINPPTVQMMRHT